MIVWRGRGILIVLVLVACMFLGVLIFPKDRADYAFIFTGFVTAIFSWFAGAAWNAKRKKRVFTNDKTGEKIIIRNSHDLFWIPMQHWGTIFAILSIIILFQNSVWLAVGALVILGLIIVVYQINKPKIIYLESEQDLPKPTVEIETKESQEHQEFLRRREEKEADHSRFMPKQD
jgi:uncharacterized membrane protein